MLAALENGVKGGKWFSLIDKVYRIETLRAAWQKVRANAGAAGWMGKAWNGLRPGQKSIWKNLNERLGWENTGQSQ
jgi:hypothetical protein